MELPKYRTLRGLQHRFRLLDCKLPANIRMFVGASIYGDLTFRFQDELFMTKEDFERKNGSRVDDWSEQSVYPYSNILHRISHAEIVRKPQYRGQYRGLGGRRSFNGLMPRRGSSRFQARLGGTSSRGSGRLGSGLSSGNVHQLDKSRDNVSTRLSGRIQITAPSTDYDAEAPTSPLGDGKVLIGGHEMKKSLSMAGKEENEDDDLNR